MAPRVLDSESIVPKLGLILLVVHKAVQKPLRRQNGQGHCTARSWFIDSGALARFYKSLEISESRIIGIQLQHRTESIDLSIFECIQDHTKIRDKVAQRFER